ncbi:MAG: hypothetical protein IKR63_00235 [Alloprevotella sp.]|nr:hypothetical protein [Alloprevotella sp.]
MAYVNCKNCGQVIQDTMPVCPHCGAPNTPVAAPQPTQPYANGAPAQPAYGAAYNNPQPQKQGNSNTVLIAIIAVLATLLVAGCAWFFFGRNTTEPQPQAAQQPTVVHDTIVKETKTIVEKPTTVVKHVRPANPTTIIVDGTNVCLRLQPYIPSGNRYANTLKYTNGSNVHPARGTALPYLGESGSFYQTQYNGYIVYIAKQFSYLQ